MGISRKQTWPNMEKLLATRPRRDLPVVLRRGKQGTTLLSDGKALTHCYPSRNGLKGAELVAEALGVDLPPVGQQVETKVPTAVAYRAVSLSSLDLRIPGIEALVERLLEEAAFQRSRAAEPPAV